MDALLILAAVVQRLSILHYHHPPRHFRGICYTLSHTAFGRQYIVAGLSEKLNLNGHFWYEHSEKLHHGITFFEDGRVVEYEPYWGWSKLFAMGKGVYQLKGDSILADIYYYDGGQSSMFWKRNIVRVKFVIIDKNTIAEVGLFRPKSGQRKEYKWVYTFDSTYVYQGRSLNRFMKKRWLWKSEADRQAWLQRQKE